MEGLWEAAVSSLELTALEVALLTVPPLVLGWCLHMVSAVVERVGIRLLGRWAWVWVLPGVVVHELSHAAMCLVFFHRIRRIRFAAQQPGGGRVGQVVHSWNPRSTYQRIGRFFIGAAPLIAGGALVYFAAAWLIPSITPAHLPFSMASLDAFQAAQDYLGRMLDALLSPAQMVRWEFYLFAYLLLALAGSLSLSASDLRGMGFGFLAVAGLAWAVNFVLCLVYPMPRLVMLLHAAAAARRYVFVLALMTFALVLNAGLLLLLQLLTGLRSRR